MPEDGDRGGVWGAKNQRCTEYGFNNFFYVVFLDNVNQLVEKRVRHYRWSL